MPQFTTFCSITNKHIQDNLRQALQFLNRHGTDLKVFTKDGSVYIRKELLQFWSQSFKDIFSSISEPKVAISLNDVSTDTIKNLKSVMTSGEIKKDLNQQEIQEMIYAGNLNLNLN